jgi:hypothetical protein
MSYGDGTGLLIIVLFTLFFIRNNVKRTNEISALISLNVNPTFGVQQIC